MSSRSRLLWHSNAPYVPTGYGMQTGLFAPELAEHYDLALSSFYGLEGSPIKWEGIHVYPGLGGSYGDGPLLAHARNHFGGDPRGGLVVTLMDVWVLDAAIMSQMNVAAWCPIDHEPPPPGVVKFFLDSGAVPIAMSRFGERMLGRLDPLYVPHAVDSTVYKPYDRAQVRRKVGVPEDAFLVGMVAANKGRPSRKCFTQAFQAFRRFREEHHNAVLYLHTTVDPDMAQGENIPKILEALEIPEDSVRIADQYRMMFDPYSPKTMAMIYSAMDVLLNPAMGEGFGVPVLEAQACGVPAIVTNFSAMPEVCGAGWHVACRPWWTGLNSWQAIPDVDDIVSALEECIALPASKREQLRQTARKHAMEYDLQRVLKVHMLPALRAAEQRFRDREPAHLKPLKVAA